VIGTDRWRSEPPCVYPPAKAGHTAKQRVGVEYSPSMLEPVRPGAVSPDRALCLPTLSHFLIVNKWNFSLSLSLSLSLFFLPSSLVLPLADTQGAGLSNIVPWVVSELNCMQYAACHNRNRMREGGCVAGRVCSAVESAVNRPYTLVTTPSLLAPSLLLCRSTPPSL
jgi:hypothetical protein